MIATEMSQNGSTSTHLCACGCKKSVKPGQRWYEPACKARRYRRQVQGNHEATSYRLYELEEALAEAEDDKSELRDKLDALEQAYSNLREEHQACRRPSVPNALPRYWDMADPYAVLGVLRFAEREAIEGAYRALAKKYHPDRHPGNPAMERRMKTLNAAYAEIMRQSGNR